MDDSFPNKKRKIEEEASTSMTQTAVADDHDENAAPPSGIIPSSPTTATEIDDQDSYHKTRGAIFILHKLPFDPPFFHLDEKDQPDEDDDNRYSTQNLAKTYLHPLIEILLSRLNQNGLVRRIYCDFGPMGYYELNPKSTYTIFQIKVAQFEAQLRELFLSGEIPDAYPNEWKWRISPDLPSIISDLPPNCIKIGCMDGPDTESDEFPEFVEYFTYAADDQIFLLVFGEIENEDIERDLDVCLQVSEFDISVLDSLVRVIPTVEKIWIRK